MYKFLFSAKKKKSVLRHLGHHVVQQYMGIEPQLVILTWLQEKEEVVSEMHSLD